MAKNAIDTLSALFEKFAAPTKVLTKEPVYHHNIFGTCVINKGNVVFAKTEKSTLLFLENRYAPG